MRKLGWLFVRYATVKERLRRAYDGQAANRALMDDQLWKQSERERFAESLRAAGLITVLEIGAGHGVSGRYLASEGFDVTCIDLSPKLVEECRRAGLKAEVMDFSNLAFPSGSFDAVFGMNCLLHVPRAELAAVLTSIRWVLRPGGLFYWGQYSLGEPFEGIYDEDSYEPKRFFAFLTDAEVLAAACEEFEVIDFRRIELDDDGRGYQSVTLQTGE